MNDENLDEPVPDIRRYEISTIFGVRTQKPLVVVRAPALECMLDPDEARRLGMNLIRAAEASTSDALMIWFANERLGATPEIAALILQDWRAWRTEMEGDGE